MSDQLTNTSVFEGMNWWIGQIADDSTWRDNELPGKFQDADTIPGWGYRYKVRIMGVHDHGSKDSDPIPEDQLPWANIMYPVTAGGGQAGASVTPNLRQGNIVFGFWMDGNDMQTPIIMGVLGNNSQTPLSKQIGKKETEGVTNTQDGKIGKSGFATGEVEKRDTTKERVRAADLQTNKPKSEEQKKECAPPPPGIKLNKFGLRSDVSLTTSQIADSLSAQAQAESIGLNKEQTIESVMKAVQAGVKNRCGAASSPLADPEPGAEMEGADNPHRLSADDVQTNDKFYEKIVLPVQQEDAVAAATKRIQIETDNLTAKVDKMLGSRKAYIDAVSGPPSPDEIKKEVRNTACKISKFQKIIMDKIAEYDNKKMNKALTTVVAAMPSSMRFMFADQKFLNTQEVTKAFNEMTNGMCDQMEGILTAKLDIANLIKQADKEATSGVLWADSNSQSAVGNLLDLGGGGSAGSGTGGGGGAGSSDGSSGGGSDDVVSVQTGITTTTPRVPICYAEDLVAQGIAANKDKIEDILKKQFNNYNKFLDGVKSQLESTDQHMKDSAADMSRNGKVTAISDEAPAAAYEPIGGSQYFTETGVPVTGGAGSGFTVNIVVPDGGWYDDSFATINEGGAGYTVNVANSGSTSGTGTTTGATTTGGSGSGAKVDYTIESGVITGISTNTAGANYKNGDVLTIVNNASGTPSTNCTFTIDKVRGTISRMSVGGIKIGNAGVGYVLGDVLVIAQEGSGNNAAIMITQVFDPGQKKATAGPVSPGDTAGPMGTWVPRTPPKKPKINPMEKMSDMIEKLGGIEGSLTQALDFKNIAGNIFPFETPPTTAVSDFYTLAQGGAGAPEVEFPSANAIDKAVSKVTKIAEATPGLDFATPSPNTPDISLISKQVSSLSSQGLKALASQEEALKIASKVSPQVAIAKAALDVAQGEDIGDVARDAATDYYGV